MSVAVLVRRAAICFAALILAVGIGAPVVLAADSALPHTGRVLISTGGDVTLPAGEHADLVMVVNGTTTIAGEANTVIAVDATVNLTGAKAETVIAVRSPVSLGAGTVVLGDVLRLDSQVTRFGNADVQGSVRDVSIDAAGIGLFLGPALLLLFLGFAVAAIAAGLLLAALAARQVRAAEALISREPIETFLVGVAGMFVPLILIVLLFITIVGAPLALGILFVAWPLAAFVGYLVAGIWLGDWILSRTSPAVTRERPYLAAAIGLVVLQVLGIWPVFSMIASLFGYGAILLLAWRTFRSLPRGADASAIPTPAPLAT
jgi:hypothetical protein